MSYLFISNRLPYELKETENGYESKLSVSGLVSGVQACFKEYGGKWLGWSGTTLEIHKQNEHIVKEWEKENYFAVTIPTDILTQAHESFNNKCIWSLFHNFPVYLDYKKSDWDAYVEYNKIFAEKVLEIYNGETILVNDFQLMLLPKMLRERLPEAKIGFFLHISMPSSDVFQYLPPGKQMLEGVLASDYLGFHTKYHVKNFIRSANRSGLEVDQSKLDVNPIGIDTSFFDANQEEVKQMAVRMKRHFEDKKIILSVGRLDFIKGSKERIEAFDYLLERYPEFRNNVVMIEVAVTSRANVDLYQNLGEEVARAAGNLNGKYGTLAWQPLKYMNTGFSQTELIALYSVSDIFMATSLIDGYVLTAEEYCMSEGDLKDRTLILSKFVGASQSLEEAVILNPYNPEDVAEKLAESLLIGGNGMMRHLQKRIKEKDIFHWFDKFKNGTENKKVETF